MPPARVMAASISGIADWHRARWASKMYRTCRRLRPALRHRGTSLCPLDHPSNLEPAGAKVPHVKPAPSAHGVRRRQRVLMRRRTVVLWSIIGPAGPVTTARRRQGRPGFGIRGEHPVGENVRTASACSAVQSGRRPGASPYSESVVVLASLDARCTGAARSGGLSACRHARRLNQLFS
jgi:hypothetical protein